MKSQSPCGNLTFQQGDTDGAAKSKLSVTVKDDPDAKILLSPASAVRELAGDQGAFRTTLETGNWQLEYASGGRICQSNISLKAVTCKSGWEDRAGKCVLKNDKEEPSICEQMHVYYAKNGTQIDKSSSKLAITTATMLKATVPRDLISKKNITGVIVPQVVPLAVSENSYLRYEYPGSYSFQIASGYEVCYLFKNVTIECASGRQVRKKCVADCPNNQTRTDDGACAPPAVKASIESDTLNLKLSKPNAHLEMPDQEVTFIQVAPAANYALDFHPPVQLSTSTLTSWVKLGGYRAARMTGKCEKDTGGTCEAEPCYGWRNAACRKGKCICTEGMCATATNYGTGKCREPSDEGRRYYSIEFDPSNISDGTQLRAEFMFGASTTDGHAPAKPGSVRLSAVLDCTPSLESSAMTIAGKKRNAAVKIIVGQAVKIEVVARDADGLLIEDARGRYIDLTFRTPAGDAIDKKMIQHDMKCY